MVGMGLTMEGQEGNQIVYDLLLDQAWDATAIDTASYFHDWVTARYHGAGHLPAGLYSAWGILRQTVYNNTDLSLGTGVTKSIFELSPNTTGLLDRTGHHSTIIPYDPAVLVSAWQHFHDAGKAEPALWDNPAYTFDLTDLTRQIMANAFYSLYTTLVTSSNRTSNSTYSPTTAQPAGSDMLALLSALDTVLASSGHASFTLSSWIDSAESRAYHPASLQNTTATTATTSSVAELADFHAYNARSQLTLWGPTGQISDYASKQWAGLVRGYYVPRWEKFVAFTLNSFTSASGANAELAESLEAFEEAWQVSVGEGELGGRQRGGGEFRKMIAEVTERWTGVFA